MTVSRLTRSGIARAAELLRAGRDGIALLRTIMAVECRGSGFDRMGRVLILYEPHVAFRAAPAGIGQRLVAQGLAYQKWGMKPYPKDSYPSFEAAAKIHMETACRACSWGLGQILGENFRAAGYTSAKQMADAFATGEDEQAAAMARFIAANPKMLAALVDHDWAGFASRYNGPGYAKNAYHTKLAAAYARFSADPWAGFNMAPAGQNQADASRAATNTAITVGTAGTAAGGGAVLTTTVEVPKPATPAMPKDSASIWPAVSLGLVFALVTGVLIFKAIKSRPTERVVTEG